MSEKDDPTLVLLQRWHAGEERALHILLERNLEWIRGRVHRRLGPLLRARAETEDYVQDAVVDVLRNGPRFLLSSQAHFRALMARIVENVLADQYARFNARCREARREQPLPRTSVLPLDAAARSVTRPSQAAQEDEERAWVQLAMALLPADERRVLVLRQWEGRSFADAGQELRISEDAARMRFNRAVANLARKLRGLKAGGSAAAGDRSPPA